jgi:uncharacterized protein (DUF488 family)
MISGTIRLYTIGFTGKSAEGFFGLLLSSGVRKLVDTRVKNSSQLAGFAKGKDLAYFCRVIGGIAYEHRLDMAPTKELLSEYRKGVMSWAAYTDRYLSLLRQRRLQERVQAADLDAACFLCSEHLPEHCHRSLLAEYLRDFIPELEVFHLH